MRIDAYNAVSQVYHTTKPVKKVNSEKAVSKDDTLEISSFGKAMHIAKKAISEAEDIRTDKVEAIKIIINNLNIIATSMQKVLITNIYFNFIQIEIWIIKIIIIIRKHDMVSIKIMIISNRRFVYL